MDEALLKLERHFGNFINLGGILRIMVKLELNFFDTLTLQYK